MDQGKVSERPFTSLSDSTALRQVKSPFVSGSDDRGADHSSLNSRVKGNKHIPKNRS
jgi:hypothetical protein